jgi:hypothetical protein
VGVSLSRSSRSVTSGSSSLRAEAVTAVADNATRSAPTFGAEAPAATIGSSQPHTEQARAGRATSSAASNERITHEGKKRLEGRMGAKETKARTVALPLDIEMRQSVAPVGCTGGACRSFDQLRERSDGRERERLRVERPERRVAAP